MSSLPNPLVVVNRVAMSLYYVDGKIQSSKSLINQPKELNPLGTYKSGCTYPCLCHGNSLPYYSLFGSSFFFTIFVFFFAIDIPAGLIRRHLCAINAECVSCILIHIYMYYRFIYELEKESQKKRGLDSRLTCFIQSGC